MVVRKSPGAPARDQSLRYLNNYLTTSDWCRLDDATTGEGAHNNTITDRLRKLGIQWAAETSLVKWIVAVLLDVEFKNSSRWPS